MLRLRGHLAAGSHAFSSLLGGPFDLVSLLTKSKGPPSDEGPFKGSFKGLLSELLQGVPFRVLFHKGAEGLVWGLGLRFYGLGFKAVEGLL